MERIVAHEKILVVDDEEDIRELLSIQLSREGYAVVCAATGDDALSKVVEDPPDLIILDLMLPGLDGLDVCRELKADSRTARIPIIMLTGKGETADIVTGLELGADDYIVKPLSRSVLLARMRAVMRKTKGRPVPDLRKIVQIHGLLIDIQRHEATVDGVRVELTASEFKLLLLLARKPGWVYSRDQIIEHLRGPNYPVTDRSVDVLVHGIRNKLGKAGRVIETVRGIGYRLIEQSE